MKKKFLLSIAVMVMVCLATALVACAPKLTQPTGIKYANNSITWDSVEAADHYVVSINGQEKGSTKKNSYYYTATEDFTVRVSAVDKNGEVEYAEKQFEYVQTVSNVRIENGKLLWNPVPTASGYIVKLDGKENSVNIPEYSSFTPGTHIVQILPVFSDERYFSSWSEQLRFDVLATPSDIAYDGKVITWTGNASQYEVTINGEKHMTNTESFVYNGQKDFDVEIRAIADKENVFNSASGSAKFFYMPSIKQVSIVDGVLHWDAVPNATEYQIKINDELQKDRVYTNEYKVKEVGETLHIEIKPINGKDTEHYFSAWSAKKEVFVLEKPVLQWTGGSNADGTEVNSITWNPINGAEGYTVKVIAPNGKETIQDKLTAQTFAYKDAYNQVGEYKVAVKANGSGERVSDSAFSEYIHINRLASVTQTAQDFIVSTKDDVTAGFAVNFNGVENARKYKIYRDGVELSGKTTTYNTIKVDGVADKKKSTEQKYTYRIQALGAEGAEIVNGVTTVYLPSLKANDLTFEITVLATPTDLRMDGMDAKWNTVQNAEGYSLLYSGNKEIKQNNTCPMDTILQEGVYHVSVCARGNGAEVLASNYTPTLDVNRLSAPDSATFKVLQEGNGRLDYTPVSYATSHAIYIDQEKVALDESAVSNMYDYIKERGTVVSMVAVANYYDASKKVYYMTSRSSNGKQFVRLAAPTFPEGFISDSTTLHWNPSNNTDGSYSPQYAVYIDGIAKGNQSSNKYTLSGLAEGKHTIKVKAIGNDTKYLNSEYSIEKQIDKLRKPTVEVKEDGYHWTSDAQVTGYTMTIDGKKVDEQVRIDGAKYVYTPHFTEKKDYVVKLYAVGDGRTTINSDPLEFIQKTDILSAPTFTVEYSQQNFVQGGKITVTVTSNSSNVSGYQYDVSGESVVVKENTFSKVIDNAGKHRVKVKAIGGKIDSNKVYYIDSQFAGEQTIQILAAPSQNSIDISGDGLITWGSVQASIGYDYQLQIDEGTWGEVTHTKTTQIQSPIADFASHHTIKIKVRACGSEDSGVIGSDWVTKIFQF